MKYLVFVFTTLLAILLLSSFQKEPPKSQQELMVEYIAEKIEAVRKAEWKKCKENTIKDAITYVDSVIASQVNFVLDDSIQSPNKPIKPSKPFDTLELDSRPITPILQDTLNQ